MQKWDKKFQFHNVGMFFKSEVALSQFDYWEYKSLFIYMRIFETHIRLSIYKIGNLTNLIFFKF